MAANSQTVTNTIDFKGSGKNVAGAPSFNYSVPPSLSFSTGANTSFSVLGVPVSLGYSLSGGVTGTLEGSLGTYNFDYPVTITVTMARDVADGEVFTVDPTLASVDDAEFSMTGPSATATMSIGFGASANLSIGDGGSILNVNPSFHTGISIPAGITKEIPQIPGASVTVEDPVAFNDTASASATGALPSLTAQGVGNSFLSGSLDLVSFAVGLLVDAGFEPAKLIDQTISFGIGKISYAIASLPLSMGLALAQTVSLKPMSVTETLTELVNGVVVSQSPSVALGTALQFTAPATGVGEIDIEARYKLSYEIETLTGLAGKISLDIGGPHASGTVLGIPFSIGPLGHANIFSFSTGNIAIGGPSTADDSVFGSTVYTLKYGFAQLIDAGTTFTITPQTVLKKGPIELDNNATIAFTGSGGVTSFVDDVLVNGSGFVDASGTLELFGKFGNYGTTPSDLTFEGGATYYILGQINVTGTVDVFNGFLYFDNNDAVVAGDFVVESQAAVNLTTNASVGSLSGGGSIESGTANGPNVTLTVGSDNHSTAFNGIFATNIGELSLTKVGTGTLQLGPFLYRGATLVKNGALDFVGSQTTLVGDVTVNSPGEILSAGDLTVGSLSGNGNVQMQAAAGSTLTIGTDGKSTTFSGVITSTGGTAALTKVGAGTLTLAGINGYTGQTTINAGTLEISSTSTTGASGSIASTSILVRTGTKLDYAVNDLKDNNYIVSAVISGAGSVKFNGQDGGVTVLAKGNSFTGGVFISSGIVDLNSNTALGSGVVTMTGGAIRANLASRTLANQFTLSGFIGLGSLTNISGAVTLAGDTFVTPSINAGGNVWSGAVNLGGHTLYTFDGGPNSKGATWANKTLTISGGVSGTGGIAQFSSGGLILSGAETYTGGTQVLLGTLTLQGAATSLAGDVDVLTGSLAINVNESLGSLSGNGTVSLNGAAGQSLTVGSDNSTQIFAGSIVKKASGADTFVKTGTGTLALYGTIDIGGAVTVAAGTLDVVNASVNSIVGAVKGSPIVIDAGAKLDFFNLDKVNDGYVLSSANGQQISGAGQLIFSGSDNSVTTLDVDDSQFTGATLISSGIVNVKGVQVFGSGVVTMTGGAIRATQVGTTLANNFVMSGAIGLGSLTSISGAITLAGDTFVTPSENSGDSTWLGAVSLGGFTLSTSDSGPDTDGGSWADEALTISGAISGSGGVTQNSLGSLVLSGDDSYTGVTTVNEGDLILSGSNPTLSGNVTVNAAGTLTVDDDASIGSLSGSGAVELHNVGGVTLTVGSDNTSTTFSGLIGNNTPGEGSLVKVGTGTLTLSGETFPGGSITVAAGTLKILNTSANSAVGYLGNGPIVIDAGATLIIDNSDTVDNGYVLSNDDDISISGAGSLVFQGPDDSVTTLNGDDNQFTGATTIKSGIVNIETGFASLGSFGSGVVTMTGGAIRATIFAPVDLANSFIISNVIGIGAATNLDGSITLAGDATITPAENIGGDTFSGAVSLGGHILATGDVGPNTDGGSWIGQALTISGAISGSGGVRQGSLGELVLSSAKSNYTGATTIAEGELSLGAANAIGTSSLSFTGSGALEFTYSGGFNRPVSIVATGISATIEVATGKGATLTGTFNEHAVAVSTLRFGSGVDTGTLVLSQSSAVSLAATRNIFVDGGALRLGSAAGVAIVNGSLLTVGTLSPTAALLDLDGQALSVASLAGGASGHIYDAAASATLTDLNLVSSTFAGIISNGAGVVSLHVEGAKTLTLSGANAYTGLTTIDAGATLQIGAGFNGSIASAVADQGTLSFVLSGSHNASNAISGSGAVTISDAGTLTLLGADSYTGATNIVSGVLALQSAGAIATSSRVAVSSGGTLQLKGGVTSAVPVTLAGAGYLNVGAIENLAGANTVSGAVTLSASATILSVAGALTLAGAVTGSGTLSLSGGGAIVVSGGIATGAGGLIKAGTGTVELEGDDTYTGLTNVSNGILEIANGSAISHDDAVSISTLGTLEILSAATIGALSGAGALLDGAALTVGSGNATSSFTGVIKDFGGAAGSLVKVGTGKLSLTNANTFSGGATVKGGVLSIAKTSALGGGVVTFAGAGGALEATATGSLADEIAIQAGAAATFEAAAGQTLTLGGEFLVSAGDSLHFGSATDVGIIDLAPSSVVGGGAGGALSVDGGSLKLANANAATLLGDFNTFAVGSGANVATLDLDGQSASVFDLAGAASGLITDNGAAATLTAFENANSVFNGVLRNGTTTGGVLSLNVSGAVASTLTLTRANTYTGQTTVGHNETLALTGAGSLAATDITLEPGATLDISGITAASATILELYGVGGILNLAGKSLTISAEGSPGTMLFEGSAGTAASHLVFSDYTPTFNLSASTFSHWTAGRDTIVISDLHGDDTVIGSSQNDLIYGASDDTLTGGGGANGFMFRAPSSGPDTITDFLANKNNYIGVSHTGFAELGLAAAQLLPAADFTAGTSPVGTNAQFLWNSATSTLSYDPDGTGSGAATAIAVLTGVTSLTASNIHVF